jgi:hypothetical protein
MAKRVTKASQSLGDLVNQLDKLDAQRSAVLQRIRGFADQMMGGGFVEGARAAATGTEVDTGKRMGRKPGFKMSAATKAKLKAAWARRKAARLDEGAQESSSAPQPSAAKGTGAKKKRTMSADARARIAAAQKKRWAALKAKKGKKA